MSDQGYEEIKILYKKIDELITRYYKLKTEYEKLKTDIDEIKQLHQDREAEMKQLESKYERVKLSGALSGDGEHATEARRKITELVREIDRCIALLNR